MRFEKDQIIRFRGHRYLVEQVDELPEQDKVLQYRLQALEDAPPAILKPEGDTFVVREYHEVKPVVVD